ncbi:MAG: HAD-IA family hydrolase [Clostridiales bacterium]|nr:HAD-IA family hydrolase [Clostridiales bacterium]
MKNIFLVDIDDTVFDFRGCANLILQRAGLSEAAASRFHEINDMLWRQLERGEMTRERLIVLRFEMLFEEFSIERDAATFAKEFFRELGNTLVYLDGAFEFLEELARRGQVFAVTNGSKEIQHKKLAHPRIKSVLSGAFISEEVGFQKPAAKFADYVEAHIEGYERARAVWIGDSLTSDMKCAMSRAIDFILFAPHGAPESYTGRYAKTYDEVLETVENM